MSHQRTIIIAEAGVNHNGSLETAINMIDVSADAGADIVKFQTFNVDELVTRNAVKAKYQEVNDSTSGTQYEMLKKLSLTREQHEKLIKHCRRRGVAFLSSPFDAQSLRLLAYDFNLPLLKMPSGEITNGPLLLEAARTKKDIILSTGMSTLDDIESALKVLAFGFLGGGNSPSKDDFSRAYESIEGKEYLNEKVTLLHCVSEYPAPYEDVNLNAMTTLSVRFGLKTGFSDHTPGIVVAIAAVAMGALVIEKHFTLDHGMSGPDHVASLDPSELENMIRSIRAVETALGNGTKAPTESEMINMPRARKSLVANTDILEGDTFSVENLAAKRSDTGMSPMDYWELLGKVANKSYIKDDLIDE